jgi:hypothetical protein
VSVEESERRIIHPVGADVSGMGFLQKYAVQKAEVRLGGR